MDRLTKWVILPGGKKMATYSDKLYDKTQNEIMDIIFDTCAKYEDLEENGLLLKLPCKVGDKFLKIENSIYGTKNICRGCKDFFIEDSSYYSSVGNMCVYCDTHDDKEPVHCLELNEYTFSSLSEIVRYLEDGEFGKTIFLLSERKEAEERIHQLKMISDIHNIDLEE